jgi:hypothetical protein
MVFAALERLYGPGLDVIQTKVTHGASSPCFNLSVSMPLRIRSSPPTNTPVTDLAKKTS